MQVYYDPPPHTHCLSAFVEAVSYIPVLFKISDVSQEKIVRFSSCSVN